MKLVACFLIVFGTACVSMEKKSSKELYSYMEQSTFPASKQEIEKVLGPPSQKSVSENSEFWIYLNNKGLQTISLRFTPSGLLQGKSMFIDEDDPLSDLNYALQHFKNATFEKTYPKWENPHAGPREIFYEDKKLGIRLTVSRSQKKVEIIRWWDTNNPPPEPKEKHPETPYKI